jgi:hypothetical protein
MTPLAWLETLQKIEKCDKNICKNLERTNCNLISRKWYTNDRQGCQQMLLTPLQKIENPVHEQLLANFG